MARTAATHKFSKDTKRMRVFKAVSPDHPVPVLYVRKTSETGQKKSISLPVS